MHRFFVEDNHIDDNIVKVTGSDFKHIYHSLRLEPGDEFIICSGDGMDHLVEIQEFKDDTVVTIIKKSYKNKNEPTIQITLAQAIPKKSNMELIVQKCTELGIHRIIPIYTERTIVKLEEKKQEKRRERWQKIAEEAAKQSRRGRIPFIDKFYKLQEMERIFQEFDLILLPWEEEKVTGLKSILKKREFNNNKLLIIIGPEGGFSSSEVEYVRKYDGMPVTLGPRILRTETAGFVTLTALLYQAGELGG